MPTFANMINLDTIALSLILPTLTKCIKHHRTTKGSQCSTHSQETILYGPIFFSSAVSAKVLDPSPHVGQEVFEKRFSETHWPIILYIINIYIYKSNNNRYQMCGDFIWSMAGLRATHRSYAFLLFLLTRNETMTQETQQTSRSEKMHWIALNEFCPVLTLDFCNFSESFKHIKFPFAHQLLKHAETCS